MSVIMQSSALQQKETIQKMSSVGSRDIFLDISAEGPQVISGLQGIFRVVLLAPEATLKGLVVL